MNINLPIHINNPQADPPAYAHHGDAGMDIRALSAITLQPFERALIPTGFSVAIPEGFAGFVQPRSGMAIKHGLSMVNTPGLIDSSYRGEIKVAAINLDPHTPIHIQPGDRIAQLVIVPVAHAEVLLVDELLDTHRGSGGFGSTGVS